MFNLKSIEENARQGVEFILGTQPFTAHLLPVALYTMWVFNLPRVARLMQAA